MWFGLLHIGELLAIKKEHRGSHLTLSLTLRSNLMQLQIFHIKFVHFIALMINIVLTSIYEFLIHFLLVQAHMFL